VIVFCAFRVVKGSPPFTTLRIFTDTNVIISISDSTSVTTSLYASDWTIISEAIRRTILSAIVSISIVTIFAISIGKCYILFFSLCGRSGYKTHSTAISILPAV
jgi:hypothetical protein